MLVCGKPEEKKNAAQWNKKGWRKLSLPPAEKRAEGWRKLSLPPAEKVSQNAAQKSLEEIGTNLAGVEESPLLEEARLRKALC